MNKELIKQIIIENQEFVRDIEIFPRNISFEQQGNYVLTGARRTGKTYAMFQVIKDKLTTGVALSDILYINFEDERLIEMKSEHLNLLLEAHAELFNSMPYMFLDEIQNILGWEKFARRLADQHYTTYITGSNAQMLSREIATTLGGRFITRDIHPLSFNEFLNVNHTQPEENWEYSAQRFEIRKLFDSYFYYGGFPEITRFTEKKLWLQNLYNKIFFGDIVARYKIRNDFALKLTIKKLAESAHDEISFNRIRHIIQSANVKIGTATIIDYIGYLKETWLLFGIKNFLAKTSEKETSGKYYFIDNGILSLFLMNAETILLENLVANHLKQKYGDELFYLKKNTEVDFYIPNEKTMVQVAYNINNTETETREIKAMINLAALVETKKMTIITLDTEKQIQYNNYIINIIPVWKWLLKDNKQ